MSDRVVTRRTGKFTQIDNEIVNNEEITWKAKGLMLYFLSKPDNWKINVRGDVIKRGVEGRDSVYNGINELIDAGYISRVKDSDGYVTYYLFENRLENNRVDYLRGKKPSPENQEEIKPHPENQDPESQEPENQDPENQDVLIRPKDNNTEDNNTECSKVAPRDKNSKPALVERMVRQGVDGDLAEEFWHYRRHIIRKPLTDRALSGVINHCLSNQFDLSRALELIMERSWTGFNVQWIKNEQASNQIGFMNSKVQKAQQVADNNDMVLENFLLRNGVRNGQ